MTERDYMLKVKEANCVICWKRLGIKSSPCHAHHVGTGDDRNDYATVSLCEEHHAGVRGVHGLHRRAFHSFWKTSDIQLLAWTIEGVMK